MITKDLIVLVADQNIYSTIKTLLDSPSKLGIQNITFDIFIHPQHDPGCRTECHNFLRIHTKSYQYAMVIFDHEGSGAESISSINLESDIENQLALNGWENDHSKVIILEPELENWVWSDSPQVDVCLGWENHEPNLRSWLHKEQWLQSGETKPQRPKEALESALREVKKPRSSSIYRELAEKVSIKRCTDASFERFLTTLTTWFS